MDPTPGADPADILADALERAPAERGAFLDRACAGNVRLRAEIESLLAHHDGGRRFFETPLVSAAADRGPGDDPRVGRTIGPWRLLRRLATGGMGAVYLGERTDREFEKQVAVKLIRTGLDSEEVLVRFRRERQVLANLEHPGIARLLDGGSTPDGLPYLVMEYVDGRRLDAWCDDRHLDVAARLRLMLDVCEAVQFAHRNLVIHRDLKPDNILVDRTGAVKLLDFGIALVIGAGESDAASTVTTSRRLTPRYASPEQVDGGRLSTATDVYSLGVVLYELLTGRSPYRGAATPVELEQAVLHQTPPRPSQAVTEESAARCGLTGRRLAQALAGDLDTIVLRALARDPERRYATVEALAGDLRRHLDGRPVQARPDTFVYRTSRFVRRNRGLTAGVLAAFVTLLGALVLTTAAYRASNASREDAEWLAYQNSLAAAESSIRTNAVGDARRRLDSAPARMRNWEWHHLQGRLDRSRRSWQGHASGITQLLVHPEDGNIVSLSTDRTLRFWSAAGDSIGTPVTFSSEVESAARHAGTGLMVVGLGNGQVHRVPAPGEPPSASPMLEGGGWARVAIAPDGELVAAGFFDGTIQVWSARTSGRTAEWKAEERLVIPTFDPRTGHILTVGPDGLLRFWHPDGRPARPPLRAHTRRIYSLAWNRAGDRLALGSMDHTVSVWDATTWTSLGVFREHRGTVAGLAFPDDDRSIVSAGADGRLLIWNIDGGAITAELRGHLSDASAVAVSPDGRSFVTGDWAGEMRLWDNTADDVTTLVTLPNRFMVPVVSSVAFDATGARVVGITNASNCFVFDRATNRSRSWALAGGSQACYVAPGVVAATATTGKLARLDVDTGELLQVVTAHPPGEMLVATGGGVLVTAGADSTIGVWSIDELAPVRRIAAGFVPQAMALDRAGGRLAAGGRGRLGIWRLDDGSLVTHLDADSAAIRGLAWEADGRSLVEATAESGIRRWNLADPEAMPATLTTQPCVCLAISPDGRRVASGVTGQLILILDAATGRELLTLHGHTGRLTALAWSPDGTTLASAATDGTIRLWDGGRTQGAVPKGE